MTLCDGQMLRQCCKVIWQYSSKWGGWERRLEMYLPGALRRISRGEVWESALLSPTLRWGLRATAGKREAGSATDSPGRQGRPLGVGKAVSSAQGSHLLLCDLGQETGFSELESLSHRVDMATSLPLSSWLAERNVIVVTSRQPPRWLGELELVPHTFYQLLLKITTSNHTVPSTGTHTGHAKVAALASHTDCSLTSHPSLRRTLHLG